MNFELDWLKRWALYSPQRVALKEADSGIEYTYQTLFRLSCQLAALLANKYQIRSGERVAVIASNQIEFLPLFFALQRLGAILVPINFRLTGREITHVLRDSSATLLIVQKQFKELTESVDPQYLPKQIWNFDGEDRLSDFLAAQHDALFVPFRGEAHSPCMVLYTSGTTGAPKGAIITNSMLHWNSLNTTLRLNVSQSDVNLSFLPFFHTGGWNVLLTPFLHRGARTVLMKKFNADRVLELCESEGVTILFGVPTTMEMMRRSQLFATADLTTVRFAIVGGEPMPTELIKTWQAKEIPIRQGFGLTEFGPNAFSLNEEDVLRKIGSVGFPNFYVETKIVDAHEVEVAPGKVGELLLKGPVCTPGYWNNPEATALAIKDGWFRTGDLVRVDSEGYFYIAGRKKDMFISGGENVYPIEVEQVLCRHPAVREAAVIGVDDAKWGEVGKAFVSLHVGTSASEKELYDFCAGQLAKFKLPQQFEFLADLPKGDSGKILKRQLRKQE